MGSVLQEHCQVRWKKLWQRIKGITTKCLGVDKNADDAALKKAYRVLAKKYHPGYESGR